MSHNSLLLSQPMAQHWDFFKAELLMTAMILMQHMSSLNGCAAWVDMCSLNSFLIRAK